MKWWLLSDGEYADYRVIGIFHGTEEEVKKLASELEEKMRRANKSKYLPEVDYEETELLNEISPE